MSQDDETKVESYYQKQAQEFIDLLFDKGYFGVATMREDIRKVEDLLAFLFQSQSQGAVKAALLLRRIRESK